ncbi:MAG: C39 family peptidase [Armatimonadetes bacterium]|nr:C39 family peptidase [Armatimonadota bacterium]
MSHRKPVATTVLLTLSLLLTTSIAPADVPTTCKIDSMQRIKQITNYCGPACLAMVFQHFGRDITQEMVGKDVYDPATGATNGADMLFYARQQGFAAYSWNSSISDLKEKLAQGVPVIILQQNSREDTSGHFRVLSGYDDQAAEFYVLDPYYDNITEMKYSECDRLWKTMGYWALLIAPVEKDKFKDQLDAKNPVVHMDLAFAKYKRKKYDSALSEARTALRLEPGNTYALSMVGKIQRALAAGPK